MKLANLDRHPSGNFPLQLVVRWLETATKSPASTWSPGQLAAAQEAIAQARELLETDVLTLAGRHFPNAEPARVADKAEGIRATIDRVERECADLTPPAPSRFCRCGLDAENCHPECPHRGQPSWAECERIRDTPAVDEAIRNLVDDHTGDNATCVVRAVLEAQG